MLPALSAAIGIQATAGTPTSVTATADDDGSMTTVPPALDNYTITGTYTQALAGGGNALGNILKENSAKTGCDAGLLRL